MARQGSRSLEKKTLEVDKFHALEWCLCYITGSYISMDILSHSYIRRTTTEVGDKTSVKKTKRDSTAYDPFDRCIGLVGVRLIINGVTTVSEEGLFVEVV